MKSDKAGDPTNDLLQFEFTNPGLSSTLPTKGNPPYPGFDGMLFRGQIDPTHLVACDKKKCTYSFDGNVNVLIDYIGGGSDSYTFTGVPDTKDFGVLGFDEQDGQSSALIKDVFIWLDSGQGAALAVDPFRATCRRGFAHRVRRPALAGSSCPSSPHRSPDCASLANAALPSPAGLRPQAG